MVLMTRAHCVLRLRLISAPRQSFLNSTLRALTTTRSTTARTSCIVGPLHVRSWSTPRCFSTEGQIFEQRVPEFGAESITEGTLVELSKGVGDTVKKGELLAVIETDKVSVDINAGASGTIKEIMCELEDEVEVDQLLMTLTDEDGFVATKVDGDGEGDSSKGPTSETGAVELVEEPADHAGEGEAVAIVGLGLRAGFARSAAIRAAHAAGLPPPVFTDQASTPSEAKKEAPPKPAAPKPAAIKHTPKISIAPATDGRPERRVPVSPIRAQVMRRIKATQNTMALLTTLQEIDMTAALEMCSTFKEMFEQTHGVPLSYLSLFVKACSQTLLEIPGVNAATDDENKEIVYHEYTDISVPIVTMRGPISCVLRNVESMSIHEIEATIANLKVKAMEGALLEDLTGGTFSIVDAGIAGGMLGTLIVNPPQSAVLGTYAIEQRAAVVDGRIMERPIMRVGLTYDHRLIDGREAATFLCNVRDRVESPLRLMLDL